MDLLQRVGARGDLEVLLGYSLDVLNPSLHALRQLVQKTLILPIRHVLLSDPSALVLGILNGLLYAFVNRQLDLLILACSLHQDSVQLIYFLINPHKGLLVVLDF